MSCALKCLIIILLPALLSCQGTPSPSGNASNVLLEGRFIDSHVQGLGFSSFASSGLTDNKGTFTYTPGSLVTFAVGDIVLGTTRGQAVITPLDLVPNAISINNPAVVNIARFLQSIDNDADASNGIVITSALRALSQGRLLDFSQPTALFSSVAQGLVNELTTATDTGARDLISEQATIEHLNTSLRLIETEIQGIRGIVEFYEGDFMPCIGDCAGRGTVTPVIRTVVVYPLTTLNQVDDLGGGFYADIQTQRVGEVRSANDGQFKIRLPAGAYSLFVLEQGALYANRLSGLTGDTVDPSVLYINPVIVKTGEAAHINIQINYLATY